MRTSQFPFETQRERQTTSSVADENESQQTVHSESQSQLPQSQVKPSKTPQVEVASSPIQVEEETKSFSQVSALSAEAQAAKPSVEQREELGDDTVVNDITTKETTLSETTQPKSSQKPSASRDIKWTPSQLSQGTRTSFSYFTPLTHLDSYTNSQSSTVDVLAVCTRPSKSPVRASAGPRDYHTLFSITDPSLPNAASVRVQVFRPWKAALPELEPGDAVLLRAFLVRSRKGRPSLLSGNESAWCVFRYGTVRRSAPGSQEVTDAEGEGEGRKKSDIADSMKPIWADHLSGLWGDVTGGLWGAVEGEAEDAPHHNGVSGATREEVHGPPVEFGDEERREAKGLREWWVGVGGKVGSEEVGVKVEGQEKEEESQNVKEEIVPVKDFFRSFW
ncbi:Telomere end binding protein [Neofusicoccum parvum]|nr:Telomere end binding protein [Neofusicoccum parvum]